MSTEALYGCAFVFYSETEKEIWTHSWVVPLFSENGGVTNLFNDDRTTNQIFALHLAKVAQVEMLHILSIYFCSSHF